MNLSISIIGSGWLGKDLAVKLQEEGHSIKISTTRSLKIKELQELGFSAFKINIEEINSTISDFLNANILIVNIPSKNINAFKNLILEIEKSKIQKVIYTSSTSVYQDLNQIVNENSPLKEHPFIQIEKQFKNANFKTTVLRFSGLYGGERQPAKWFKNKSVPNAKAKVNMIHRQDCIAIMTKIITGNHFPYTFNACSNQHPSKEEFYTQSAKNLKIKTPSFNFEPKDSKIIDSSFLQKILNYKFLH